jgi:Tol biopolymer transport system component
MPDVNEVFEMVSQKTDPDAGALQRQHEAQDRRRRRQRGGSALLAGVVVAALVVFFLVSSGTGSGDDAANHGATPTHGATPAITGFASTSPTFVSLTGGATGRVKLASDAWEPVLSPDGAWVAYVTASTDVGFCGACTDGPRIAVVKVDGTRSHYVTVHNMPWTTRVDQPAWSPDGSQIAFVGSNGKGTGGNIFVVDANGQGLRRLTSGPTQKSWPAWAPDGSSIIYSDAGKTPLDSDGFSPTQEIYEVAANGAGNPMRITTNHDDDSQAVFSPDGSKIAAFHSGGLVVMEPDGTNVRSLGQDGFAPRWSPDGTRIAFLTYNPSERFDRPDVAAGGWFSWPRLDVKVLTLATGKVADLGVSVASDFNAVSWTPDGQQILVNRAWNPQS